MTDSPSVPTVNPSLRPFSSISDESIQNQHDIASRLLKIGRVHLNINPGIVPHMVSMLNGMGYKKRIWQSPDQFISHCASSYNEALYTLLELTLLIGPQMSDGCYECWYGNGEYAGKLSFSQRLDFQKHANNKIFVVIDIQFFVAQMSVLLAAGSCGGVSRHE